MRKNSCLLLLAAGLLGACGRAGDSPRAVSPQALERSTATSPASGGSAPRAAAKRVEMPPREALTDASITARIRSELLGDPAMSGADVSINTDNGVVVLSGTVKTHEQTGIASAHAQRQDGVMRVDNHLRPEYS